MDLRLLWHLLLQQQATGRDEISSWIQQRVHFRKFCATKTHFYVNCVALTERKQKLFLSRVCVQVRQRMKEEQRTSEESNKCQSISKFCFVNIAVKQ